jgi:hypothetical protein
MTIQEDQDFTKYLTSINVKLQYIFTYSVPWLGLALSILALIALIKPRRRVQGKSLLIYIFKWQYAIAIIYWLNLIFNDDPYSKKLFNYSLRQNLSDPICKLTFMLLKFIYCTSPWMQVVIFLLLYHITMF